MKGAARNRSGSSSPRPARRPLREAATEALASRWRRPLWMAATLAGVLPIAFHRMHAQDIWWHLSAGELMLDRHSLPRVDPWSFSRAGQPWVNHEWFADLLFAVWEKCLGVESLMFWQLAVLAAAYLLLFELLRRCTQHSLASFLATGAAALLGRPVFEIRPHLYTLLLLVVTLWICWLGSRRTLLCLPVLFLLWSNLHSGVVLGLAWLAIGLWARAAREGRARWIETAVVFVASALATLAHPYGIEALLYPFAFARGTSPFTGLVEWLSPFSPYALRVPGYEVGLVAAAIAATACATSAAVRKRTPLGGYALAIAGGSTAMSLVSSRFAPYFGLSLALLVAPLLAVALPRVAADLPTRASLAVPVVALAVGLWASLRIPWSHGFGVLTTLELLPVDSCTFWNANRLRGNVLTYFGWGGYAIWCSDGTMRPYIDGRADTVYDAATNRRYSRFQDLGPAWSSVPSSVGADFVLWPTLPTSELPVVAHSAGLLRSGRWRLLYQDYSSVLLARSDLELPALRSPPPSAFHHLALGAAAMRGGKLSEAEAHLSRAFAADPGLLGACRNLALVQAKRHEPVAKETYRRCQRLANEPETGERIGELLARPPDRPSS